MVQWHPSLTLEHTPKSGKKLFGAPPFILSASFALLILVGTCLLKLPIATESPITWLQSLFTVTSAVTVTGLVVVDTGSVFTPFGQVIIALLIQCGGLGLMTFAIVTLIALGGKIGFLQQTVAKEAFNQTDTSTLVSTAKAVLMFSLLVEAVGMLILSVYWSGELGWQTSLFHGFFYTISAFNNAGFALSPDSLIPYVADPVVNLTITGLFIVGGLGFSVWIDLKRNKRWSKLTVYSRMMITGTILINAVAVIAIYLIEYNNPNTLAPLSELGKWLASWFQAVTPRTAGFNTLAIDKLEDGTTLLMLVLMFIGGGSLSTASGIKVVTFMVLILATYGYLRRDEAVYVFKREIPKDTISKALALTMISIGVTWLAIFALVLTEKAPMMDIAFEAVSALGTVGLSRGLTGNLSSAGQGIIIFMMFMGRLGPLMLAYFLANPRVKKLRYAETKLAIG
ncbi:TrkH family potassium uptake protein [Shewanella xiamenensis]|uniref:TrkH family potassium uptake protein n=1 Tax=Shewanella xiamenensis TaxID=332186 RepID=UPI0024A6ED5B|nr:TrkH family potassium uptake protein [Shewanella xiamenensis]MDI5836351.1 TrkH family potassium uptake protein [Shewanella xiamenensis]MDI5840330.1 TrkH family potassium uptake protein [Shewanella xiamenensis]MDI5844113.1 TrkH family potassium uptake protein [Shewanella xiamenensis]MDI5852070.1 TrkH family potassium uptake protein [Shewanella xiamenensis]MDI5855452.1 TrkH family potassium uptake protein [Shewanella xiamenensis]